MPSIFRSVSASTVDTGVATIPAEEFSEFWNGSSDSDYEEVRAWIFRTAAVESCII